jgi:hypothetical protein
MFNKLKGAAQAAPFLYADLGAAVFLYLGHDASRVDSAKSFWSRDLSPELFASVLSNAILHQRFQTFDFPLRLTTWRFMASVTSVFFA